MDRETGKDGDNVDAKADGTWNMEQEGVNERAELQGGCAEASGHPSLRVCDSRIIASLSMTPTGTVQGIRAGWSLEASRRVTGLKFPGTWHLAPGLRRSADAMSLDAGHIQ